MKTHLSYFALLLLFILAASRTGQAQTTPPTTPAQAPVPQAPALTAPQGKVARPPGPVDIANEPIVKIVANVQPAVVNIAAQGTVPAYVTNQFFQLYRNGNRISQSI